MSTAPTAATARPTRALLTPTRIYAFALARCSFGTFNYYVAKLNPDLVTLAEAPRGPLVVHDAFGPFGPGKLDDKAFMHKRFGRYYLSWGCFYGIGDSPYGPFEYMGVIYDNQYVAPSFR